jgi:hypothetical protein
MSTHAPHSLLKLWKLEQLPTEMAIGHILQNLVTMQETIDTFRRTLTRLGATVSIDSSQQGREESIQKGKQKSSKSDETSDPE